jgi:hypothetical protein
MGTGGCSACVGESMPNTRQKAQWKLVTGGMRVGVRVSSKSARLTVRGARSMTGVDVVVARWGRRAQLRDVADLRAGPQPVGP